MLLGNLDEVFDVGPGDDLACGIAGGDDCQGSDTQPIFSCLRIGATPLRLQLW